MGQSREGNELGHRQFLPTGRTSVIKATENCIRAERYRWSAKKILQERVWGGDMIDCRVSTDCDCYGWMPRNHNKSGNVVEHRKQE